MNGIQKRFQPGDIVYWHNQRGNGHYVEFGMVAEHFSDAIIVDRLETKECRYINGIPLNDFPAVSEWRKLPKGWTYNTKLFDLDWRYEPADEKYKTYSINNPDQVKEAFADGWLILASKKFQGQIETEIDKSKGFRIIKRYSSAYHYKPNSYSLRHDEVFDNYEEAKASVDAYNAELERQAALSDYEWSVELIDKALNNWARIYDIPEDTKLKYRDWLLQLDNVEDIEVRISGGNVEWKYWKNKKWAAISLVI